MFQLFLILAIVVAVLLILIVLVQNSKGGGLSSQFGGSGAQQVIGVKKTTDLLEKVTWGFAIALLALSLSSSLMIEKPGAFDDNANLDAAEQQQQFQQNQALPSVGDTTSNNIVLPADTSSQD